MKFDRLAAIQKELTDRLNGRSREGLEIACYRDEAGIPGLFIVAQSEAQRRLAEEFISEQPKELRSQVKIRDSKGPVPVTFGLGD